MKHTSMVLALLLSAHAHADDASKLAKIAQVAIAQGLKPMFEQQLDQSRAVVSSLGKEYIDSVLAEQEEASAPHSASLDPGTAKSILDKAMAKLREKCAATFSEKDIVDTWSRNYGKDLSESDVDAILAYYSSSTGRKDVQATRAAYTTYASTMYKLDEERTVALLDDFKKEVKAALKK